MTSSETDSLSLISLRDLSFDYRGGVAVHALRDVNLEVRSGEMIALLGASGSGKSTLLSLLGLLRRPTQGEYYLQGRPTSRQSETELAALRNSRIGFIFQHHFLLPELTSVENVALNQVIGSHASWDEAKDKSARLLTALGLEHRLHHTSRQLSGGEQQRVAVARALINNPDLILADEPTGNLDSVNSRRILSIFRSLFGKRSYTLVIATHSPAVARICPRRLYIRDGNLVDDETDELALGAFEAGEQALHAAEE